MRTNSLQSANSSFLKICGLIISIVIGTIQCSWTPTVETPIHSSEQGSIALQTSNAFRISPHHPQFLSEPLVRQILLGVSQSQENGILQEIFLSTPEQTPVFSQTQIDFLAPHIVAAFTQVTSEEHITFQVAGDGDAMRPLSGTVTMFPPEIFFLTLKHSGSYQRNSSKIGSSSRQLLNQTRLLYSQEAAVLQREDAKSFRDNSSKDPWIAINYAALTSSEGRRDLKEITTPSTGKSSQQPQESQTETETFQKQLKDLQDTVNEQSKEIQRLQQVSPQ